MARFNGGRSSYLLSNSYFLIYFLHEIGLTATTLIEFENSFLRREHQVRFYSTEFVIFSITFVVFSHIPVSPESKQRCQQGVIMCL